MTTWECWEVLLKGSSKDADEEAAAIKMISDGIKELAAKVPEKFPELRIEVK